MTVPEHILWATAVILAVLLLRHTLGRRIPALGRYALWLLVVLRLLVPGRLAVWPAPAAEEAVPTPAAQAVPKFVLPGLYEDIQKITYVQRRSVSDILGEQMDWHRNEHIES